MILAGCYHYTHASKFLLSRKKKPSHLFWFWRCISKKKKKKVISI